MRGPDAGFLDHEEAGGAGALAEPDPVGEHGGIPGDQRPAELAVLEQRCLDRGALGIGTEIAALGLERADRLGVDRIDHHQRVLGGAGGRVVEGFGARDPAAAAARSALSSTITGTLPAPTPIAGVPLA